MIDIEKLILVFVEVEMIARENTIVPFILRFLFVYKDLSVDKTLHLGFLNELLFNLHIKLSQLFIILFSLFLRDGKDVFQVVQIVVYCV